MPLNIYEELAQRDLIFQESDERGIADLLKVGATSVYAGFDPTADSLHIGSLVPLIALRGFQDKGHNPIVVIGGGTGLIGDPSGKIAERRMNEKAIVDDWTEKIGNQIQNFLDFSARRNAVRLVNNYDWIGSLSAMSLLRELGKHFTVNWMLAKESVKTRVNDPHSTISYTEFSYMVLQAYDYLHLAENFDCRLQIGGSD